MSDDDHERGYWVTFPMPVFVPEPEPPWTWIDTAAVIGILAIVGAILALVLL